MVIECWQAVLFTPALQAFGNLTGTGGVLSCCRPLTTLDKTKPRFSYGRGFAEPKRRTIPHVLDYQVNQAAIIPFAKST